jgi:Tol biopolymer transport system component
MRECERDTAARTARIVHEGVECPSLSPDETRIAFKKRVGIANRVEWRPYVLDLATMTETALGETRNVDDQIEWLDDQHVVYALAESGPPRTTATDVWVVPVDGSAPPRVLIPQAYSPAVVR